MFLQKKYRLTGKDINFLLSKRNSLHSRFFSGLWFFQYHNKQFHQYSVNIGLKFSKFAVKRRSFKKLILSILREELPSLQPHNGKFYKVFIHLNKNIITEIVSHYDLFTKDAVHSDFLLILKKDIKNLLSKL